MTNYTLTQREFSALKSKLTKAINSGDHERVIACRNEAFAIFERKGYPDDWARWERAADDARFALRF